MNISLLFGMQVGGLRKGAFSHLGKDTWDVINYCLKERRSYTVL